MQGNGRKLGTPGDLVRDNSVEENCCSTNAERCGAGLETGLRATGHLGTVEELTCNIVTFMTKLVI